MPSSIINLIKQSLGEVVVFIQGQQNEMIEMILKKIVTSHLKTYSFKSLVECGELLIHIAYLDENRVLTGYIKSAYFKNDANETEFLEGLPKNLYDVSYDDGAWLGLVLLSHPESCGSVLETSTLCAIKEYVPHLTIEHILYESGIVEDYEYCYMHINNTFLSPDDSLKVLDFLKYEKTCRLRMAG